MTPRTVRLDGNTLPDRQLIGGKAWSIAHMRSLGILVPPAFVITTDAYRSFADSNALSTDLWQEIEGQLSWLEAQSDRTFGASSSPLLLSVRSGAAISMPGMMDTVLNLGMTDDAEAALARESGSARFARDTHGRFLELYSGIVLGIDTSKLTWSEEPEVLREQIGQVAGEVAWDPPSQLRSAILAVFRSWNSRRAKRYRAHQGISDALGTAVTVQAMVFGNLSEDSGTGVLFSRNPLNGDNEIFGEYLRRAQGEDVVSGKVTPRPLADLASEAPPLHAEILAAARALEDANREIQDIEFTVESGRLYLLQCRTAKLSARATIQTSIDLVAEGVLSQREGLARVSPDHVRAILSPRLRAGHDDAPVLARGETACSGVGTGVVVDDPDRAVELAEQGIDVILARRTTSPEDLSGMLASKAVVTEEGGSTSHAAVVSRGLGLPCVVGCGRDTLLGHVGKTVTVDGLTGVIYEGSLEVEIPRESDWAQLQVLIDWANVCSPIQVVPRETAPHDLLDLNLVPEAADPDLIGRVLSERRGQPAVTGGAISTPQGVAAAIAAGFTYIATTPVLPTLLLATRMNDAPATDRKAHT